LSYGKDKNNKENQPRFNVDQSPVSFWC